MNVMKEADISIYHIDCMEFMKNKPDKYYDIAIVDPPYGGGGNGAILRTGGTWSEKYQKREVSIKKWDFPPPPEYFKELFRVSKNQIIWGGNYFDLPPCRCFIVWHKLSIPENFTMAMCEYAWTSFNANAKLFSYAPQGNKNNQRIHPTQKPVALYKWLITRYSVKGDRILDTHGGSMSIALAAYDLNATLEVCEVNPIYFNSGARRFKQYTQQPNLSLF